MAKNVHFTKATTTLKGFTVSKSGEVTPLEPMLVFDTVKSMETARAILAKEYNLDKTVVIPTEIERAEKHYEIPYEVFMEFAVEREPLRTRKKADEQ